jgi:hypothetical protein
MKELLDEMLAKVPAGFRAVIEPLLRNAFEKYKPALVEIAPEKQQDAVAELMTICAASPCKLVKVTADIDGKPLVTLAVFDK